MAGHSENGVQFARMERMDRLANAVTSEQIVSEITTDFGPSAKLYAVDREFGTLVCIDNPAERVELVAELRLAVLRTHDHYDGHRTWIPFPERDQVVFVVAIPGDQRAQRADVASVGYVLGSHRRRFENLERDRRRAQMSVAAELQWDLLPIRADTFGEYQVAGVLEPAYEVAGDVFDYSSTGDSVWAYSFDGMGHGIEATMTSVLVLSAVRNSRRQGGTLVEQMTLANEVVWDQYRGDRFVTGAACRLSSDGAVEVVNAGHEPIRTVIDGHVERLDLVADLPLGVQPSVSYSLQQAAKLGRGDGIAMFSDGPASQSAGGDPYGDDHLDDTLADKWSDVPLQTGHDVISDVVDFLGDDGVDDDVTAVVVRRKSSSNEDDPQ